MLLRQVFDMMFSFAARALDGETHDVVAITLWAFEQITVLLYPMSVKGF